MIGRTLSHYKILDEVSRGGMGVVYRSVDTKLDREVALKVLPAELVSDAERRERFIQEAKRRCRVEASGFEGRPQQNEQNPLSAPKIYTEQSLQTCRPRQGSPASPKSPEDAHEIHGKWREKKNRQPWAGEAQATSAWARLSIGVHLVPRHESITTPNVLFHSVLIEDGQRPKSVTVPSPKSSPSSPST